MPMRILSRLIDIEFVMRVFNQRHLEPFHDQAGNELLDECGFAATGVAGDGDGFHEVIVARWGGRITQLMVASGMRGMTV